MMAGLMLDFWYGWKVFFGAVLAVLGWLGEMDKNGVALDWIRENWLGSELR
jgi:hypothetical protein